MDQKHRRPASPDDHMCLVGKNLKLLIFLRSDSAGSARLVGGNDLVAGVQYLTSRWNRG